MRISLAFLFIAAALHAQTFDVVSVKANRSLDPGAMFRNDPNHFVAKNVTLRSLVRTAWNLRDAELIGAPGWVDAERWDVEAKPESAMPKGEAGLGPLRAMMRALLIERFSLTVHKEKREMPVYAIVPAKGGSKLKPAAADAKDGESWGPGMIRGNKMTLSSLARLLSDQLGRPVIDESGVSGEYDVNLSFAPESAQDTDRPSLFAALQEQAGLRLESRKGQVEVVVIDKVERASEN